MITCDTREPRPNAAKPKNPDIAKLIKERGVDADWQQLEVGDYQMRDWEDELVLVTRKSSDLLPSVFDGHFKEEIQKCIALIKSSGGGGKLFFINEGPWGTTAGGLGHYKKAGPDFYRINGNAHHAAPAVLPGLQISLQCAGIFEVYTTSLQETADALVSIYQRGQDGWPTAFLRGLRRPELKWSDDSRVARLMALWPHLNEKAATALIDSYHSIGYIVAVATGANPNELMRVEGIGKKGIQNFLEVLS